jgi:hypothetical protein
LHRKAGIVFAIQAIGLGQRLRLFSYFLWRLADAQLRYTLFMTEEELVAFALGLPDATESAHFGTRDFRVRGKIFLTLPSQDFCVVQLKPDQQQMALATTPDMVAPVPGGWGERGSTRLFYRPADDATIHALVQQAWKNSAPKSRIAKED